MDSCHSLLKSTSSAFLALYVFLLRGAPSIWSEEPRPSLQSLKCCARHHPIKVVGEVGKVEERDEGGIVGGSGVPVQLQSVREK